MFQLCVIAVLVWLLIQLINLIAPPTGIRQGLSIVVVAVAVVAVFYLAGWPLRLR